MKPVRPVLIAKFIFILIIIFSINTCLSETDDISHIEFSFENNVRVQKAGSEGWLNIEPGYELLSGDKISVLEESSADINIYSSLSVNLGPFTVIEFTADSSVNLISIERGQVSIETNVSTENNFDVKTPISYLKFNDCKSDILVGGDGSTEIMVFHGGINLTTIPFNDTTQTDNRIAYGRLLNTAAVSQQDVMHAATLHFRTR